MPSKVKNVSRQTAQTLWYKDAIIYEVHVRAFFDSDGNGIGDFKGLSQKLDYLQDLGVTAIWLLPFYPSPLKDDGYDIASYNSVNPSYGTMADFKEFLDEAHRRDLRVITELVVNHTSDQHPWFQRARNSKPGSKWRDYYVWSDSPEKYKDARIIFQDYETSNWTWDPVAGAYYWHRFFSHQPDLNFENSDVHDAIFQVMKLWLDMGVDGMRLDAVPYLYEEEGTNCENLPRTHEFLKKLRAQVDTQYPDGMLLAEANQWPEDSVAYFGNGDECHMAFHFPVMPRLFMSIQMEDRFPIIDIMDQTPPIPGTCQWAVFLRNHDELTLEMVTDEERDYMYRMYAHDAQARINLGIRRRLAPLMQNDRRRIELMKGLLFSLPGTPVLYYGDEIGMGDNFFLGDRNGVRTPMQWNSDRNAGFSKTNPQRLYLPLIIDPEYHYEAINVEAQLNNTNSLLWWMKRLLSMRKHYKAFSRGSLEFLYPENRKVLAFLRKHENEQILVLANLSRHLQYVELDLSASKGLVPVEAVSRMEFPQIGDLPYFFTLAPYAFYWFSLEPHVTQKGQPIVLTSPEQIPRLTVQNKWESIFSGRSKSELEKILLAYIPAKRWFGGKARKLKAVEIVDSAPLANDIAASFVFVQISYAEEEPDLYMLPLSYASGHQADELRSYQIQSVVANLAVKGKEENGVLYEAVMDPAFNQALLSAFGKHRKIKTVRGELHFTNTPGLKQRLSGGNGKIEATVSRAEQSNTSIIYGDRLILKLYRKLDVGLNPDQEIGAFLTERAFQNTSHLAGAIELHAQKSQPMTLGLLQNFVHNEGDAWSYTLDSVSKFLDSAHMEKVEVPHVDFSVEQLLHRIQDAPGTVFEPLGSYLESVRILGQRTAEMHRILASETREAAFKPEPFSTLYQRSLFQSQRGLTAQVFQMMRKKIKDLPETMRQDAQSILDLREDILNRFRSMLKRKINAVRTRIHGDYHLGQVLFTGKDFIIIDFEGEPLRPISERRIKRSPLRDVAGMLRSFHYAAYSALFSRQTGGTMRPEECQSLESWARFWNLWVSVYFFKGYMNVASREAFIPHEAEELQILLECYLLEKAIYEVGYELNNRPDWLKIPFQGILQLVGSAASASVCPTGGKTEAVALPVAK